MRDQRSDRNTTPVVANPDRRLAAKVIMEFRHVGHDLLDGVGVIGRRHGRAAVAAQIGATHCQPSAANAFIWARHIKPMLGQPWRKIINGP
jgi:hypothetical protein